MALNNTHLLAHHTHRSQVQEGSTILYLGSHKGKISFSGAKIFSEGSEEKPSPSLVQVVGRI